MVLPRRNDKVGQIVQGFVDYIHYFNSHASRMSATVSSRKICMLNLHVQSITVVLVCKVLSRLYYSSLDNRVVSCVWYQRREWDRFETRKAKFKKTVIILNEGDIKVTLNFYVCVARIVMVLFIQNCKYYKRTRIESRKNQEFILGHIETGCCKFWSTQDLE